MVKTGLLLTRLRQTDTQAMIAKGPENLKLCHSYLLTSDTRICRTFVKLAAGEVISLTAAMQTFGAQWGETDKVTYIQLRLHDCMSYFQGTNAIFGWKDINSLKCDINNYIKIYELKNYVCKTGFKIRNYLVIL